ncbi:MAG: hypothetical protein PHD61_10605 [Bacteroidales bacterium]|nr:hypothetical protein [Lentimicrobiaceae bacterium]MDD5695737.1 hypothetical protein [Bacteroidales bacterium]
MKMRLIVQIVVITFLLLNLGSCDGNRSVKKEPAANENPLQDTVIEVQDPLHPVYAILVVPRTPVPGEGFRIITTGGKNLRKAKIIVSSPSGNMESLKSKTGEELPFWRMDEFAGCPAGTYTATLIVNKKDVSHLEFEIAPLKETPRQGTVWKTMRGWDSGTETLFSAWINALFGSCNEQSSWTALHEMMRDRDRNFLYNYLSLGEDDPASKTTVIMEPDCADFPFFLRAYFAWKLGLPFGYHICDRGWVGRSPRPGQWITNETSSSRSNPVLAFNSFLLNMMNGVHSGTARTALDNESSDYYPVALSREALRPGTVYADPYGHTLILVSWVPQTRDHPGLLLAVDAQPDNTIAIKRFWKGNFLFNTAEVVGEPGFKAFRPVSFKNGKLQLMKNEALTDSAGYVPFSLEQKNMQSDDFYLAMERLINPEPLDPEEALTDLVRALHEQLLVRVKSVANGEAYLRAHPGMVISMPSSANGVFLAGGPWEDYSTPNRDLRLLIAMDAVLDFPGRVADSPGDFKGSGSKSPEEIRNSLQSLLEKKVSALTITYTRSDGTSQELSLAEILDRKEAFEMAYNPNDCVEVRWGAPENSAERSTCRRQAPPYQRKTMQSVRKWFAQQLHPPT